MQVSFESSSYYYFHRILSSTDYMIGKKTKVFIEKFFRDYADVVKSIEKIPKLVKL